MWFLFCFFQKVGEFLLKEKWTERYAKTKISTQKFLTILQFPKENIYLYKDIQLIIYRSKTLENSTLTGLIYIHCY